MNPAIETREWSCPECGEDMGTGWCPGCEWEANEPDFATLAQSHAEAWEWQGAEREWAGQD